MKNTIVCICTRTLRCTIPYIKCMNTHTYVNITTEQQSKIIHIHYPISVC